MGSYTASGLVCNSGERGSCDGKHYCVQRHDWKRSSDAAFSHCASVDMNMYLCCLCMC